MCPWSQHINSLCFSALMVPSQKFKWPKPSAARQPHNISDPGLLLIRDRIGLFVFGPEDILPNFSKTKIKNSDFSNHRPHFHCIKPHLRCLQLYDLDVNTTSGLFFFFGTESGNCDCRFIWWCLKKLSQINPVSNSWYNLVISAISVCWFLLRSCLSDWRSRTSSLGLCLSLLRTKIKHIFIFPCGQFVLQPAVKTTTTNK